MNKMRSATMIHAAPGTPDGTYGATLTVDVYVRNGEVISVLPRYDYELSIVEGKPGVSGYKIAAEKHEDAA